jgi:hypothetical protein
MKSMTAKFSGTDASLTVQAKVGKKNIRVSARMKVGGQSSIGCRETFTLEQEKQATTSFERLKQDAIKQGWVEVVRQPKDRDAFKAIPSAPKPAKKNAA